MVMDIKFKQLAITLLPSGALYIHSSQTLVLADLHLGKGVLLQDSGVPLIGQVDQKTVTKLVNDLSLVSPKTCVVCGDLIHAKSKHMPQQLAWFVDQLRQFDCEFVLTMGNHDANDYVNDLSIFTCVESFNVGGVVCVHEPGGNVPYIAGHIHPGVIIKKGRLKKTYKAFMVGDRGIVCPSYGETAGLFCTRDESSDYYYIKNGVLVRHD